MLERRQLPRSRVYYGGLVAFNARSSTLACVVRNFSKHGAKIEFENSTMLPDRVDFEIERRSLSCRAHLVWRDHNASTRERTRDHGHCSADDRGDQHDATGTTRAVARGRTSASTQQELLV